MVSNAMESLIKNGFINYYGLQRFGNCKDIPTYDIGRALINQKWATAAELLMKPRKNESEPWYMVEMRNYWWHNRSPASALTFINDTNNSLEARFLRFLVKCGARNYLTAFTMVCFISVLFLKN